MFFQMSDPLFEPNLLTMTSDRTFCLNTVICNQAHQSRSVIIQTALRRPTSITLLRAAKWGRIQCLWVVRVNWSIKIPAALLQLKAALAVSDQPVSLSCTSETCRVLISLFSICHCWVVLVPWCLCSVFPNDPFNANQAV